MRKKLLIILCIVSVLLLVEICFLVHMQKTPKEVKLLSRETESVQMETPTESVCVDETGITAPVTTAIPTDHTEPKQSGPENSAQSSNKETAETSGSTRKEQIAKPAKPVKPAATEPAPEPIEFPYQIPETTLEIRSISSYDGIFLEDGSDQEISAVAAAIICNVGDMPVEYAEIKLEGGELTFVVTALDAESIAIVQELNGKDYESCDWYECSADVAYMTAMELSDGIVKISENEDGTLSVANISGERIPCLRIFYKFYMADQNAYVGGITYNVKILNLDAGQSQTVTPSHYIPGYSRIVMVKNYDEEN